MTFDTGGPDKSNLMLQSSGLPAPGWAPAEEVTMTTTRGKSALAWLATACLAWALAACGGSEDPTPPPSTGHATIGAAGGEVAGPDGVKLIVPEGAFEQDTTVRVARDGSGAPEVGGLRLLTPIYQVTPHGAEFESPARILIPFDDGDRRSPTAPVIIRTQPGADHWEVLQTDVDGGLAAADSFGFSYYAVGECYIARDVPVVGPDPIASCPSGHALQLQMRDAGGNPVEIQRSNLGTLLPMLTITEPTPVVVQLDWQRPPGTSREDRIELRVTSKKPAGLVKDLLVNQNTYILTAGDIIDPSDYPGALAPSGQHVTISAHVSYQFTAFYPGCACFRPASWVYSTSLLLKAVNPGTAPVINQQPTNQSVLQGESASFSVTASGIGLQYQWQRSAPGASTFDDLPGEQLASHVTPATTLADSGARYRVRVCASGASRPCVDSDAATLTVSKMPVVPSFALQPVSQSIVTGQTASFSVRASGEPAPRVQWYRASTSGDVAVGLMCAADPSGTTACHYTTPVLDESDSGSVFYARAENTAGQTDSLRATITVTAVPVPPSIVSEPVDQSVAAGASASFTVQAAGTAPLSYQWYRDGQPISGAQGDTLTLPSVSNADNGATFHVVVTNAEGDATSATVTLTVTVPVCAAPVLVRTMPTDAGTSLAIAMDDAGYATALWSELDASHDNAPPQASRYAPGTGWSAAQSVGGFTGSPAKAVVDGTGKVLVAMRDSGFDYVMQYPLGGGWDFSPGGWSGGHTNVDLALAPGGEGIAAWQTSSGAIYTQFYRGGAWSAPSVQQVSASGALGAVPKVAIDGNGNALVVWRQQVDASAHLFASHYSADDASWSAPAQIESLGDAPQRWDLAMNSAGQGAVLWYGSGYAVYVQRYQPGSGWAAPETLESSTAEDYSGLLEPNEARLAIDGSGNMVAAWPSATTAHVYHVHARRYDAGTNSWSTIQELQDAGGSSAWTAEVAVTPGGAGMVIMQQWIGDRFAVVANRFSATGTWSGAERLAFDTTTDDMYRPRLALNASGGYGVVWQQDSREIWALHCD